MNNVPDGSVPEFRSAPQPPREGSGLSIASMVLGILSFVFCGPLFAVPAVILGHMSLNKVRQGLMPADARGFAVAGLVLGYVNLAIFVLVVIPLILFILLAHGASQVSPFIYMK
jgi:hypothetical protein